MANTPLKMTIPQTHEELTKAWTGFLQSRENPARAGIAYAINPFGDRLMHMTMRMLFRGIYFPQLNKRDWAKTVMANRRPIYRLAREGVRQMARGPTQLVSGFASNRVKSLLLQNDRSRNLLQVPPHLDQLPDISRYAIQ